MTKEEFKAISAAQQVATYMKSGLLSIADMTEYESWKDIRDYIRVEAQTAGEIALVLGNLLNEKSDEEE